MTRPRPTRTKPKKKPKAARQGDKELRMEGYDICRRRLYRYLMEKAGNRSDSKTVRWEFQCAAEYVGMFMNDYLGEPDTRKGEPSR